MRKTATSAEERSPKDGPWLWLNKSAIRAIRTHLKGGYDHALAVYLALGETASNQESECFALSIGNLSKLAGVGKGTVRGVVREFEKLGLIKVVRSRSPDGMTNLPCYFTLLAVKVIPETSTPASPSRPKRTAKPSLGW